jgi:hypothetical protein
MAHPYDENRQRGRATRLDFTPTFPGFLPNDKRGSNRKSDLVYRLPDATRNDSDTLAYDSHGYIYNTMSEMSHHQASVGTTIATEEIEFEYPDEDEDGGNDDGETTESDESSAAALYARAQDSSGVAATAATAAAAA